MGDLRENGRPRRREREWEAQENVYGGPGRERMGGLGGEKEIGGLGDREWEAWEREWEAQEKVKGVLEERMGGL